MRRDWIWSILFAAAIAVLMLGLLLARHVTPPIWVLVIYPMVGGLLAHLVSRTCPNRRQIAWFETASIAAACVVVVVLGVNALIGEVIVEATKRDGALAALSEASLLVFVTAGAITLWWALERRIKRLRATHEGSESGGNSR